MKERPIIFSETLVRAILAGQKTQTRRVVKPTPDFVAGNGSIVARFTPDDQKLGRLGETIKCPYGQPGDRLLVRETFFAYGRWETKKGRDEWHFIDMTEECGYTYRYAADHKELFPLGTMRSVLPGWHRRPAIFMPRRAVRIFLEVIAVRVERLHDISEADAFDEGIIQQKTTGWFSVPGINGAGTTARAAYALLWNSINGAGSWDKNPWVWVVEFKRIESQKGPE